MKTSINKIKANPNNPRVIKDYAFKKLVDSIKQFPEMLEKRPIVIDENNMILGGNMRYKAALEAGLKDISVIIADDWSENQKKEFIIKDNVGYGEWDWDVLANEWNEQQLDDWNLTTPDMFQDITEDDDDDIYSKKINAPLYEPNNKKPNISELIDLKKYNDLITEIEKTSLNEEEKNLLKLASARHIIFYFDKIADYYAHSKNEIKELFEKNALVIIDFDKAIRNGYVELQESVYKQYAKDYG